MRALKWFVGFTFIFSIITGSMAWSGEVEHSHGIELRGGYALYLNNNDPDTYAEQFNGVTANGYSQKEFSKSSGSISGGISVLYKTQNYLQWNVGLNVLGTDSATAIATKPGAVDQVGNVYYNATELYFTASYVWNISSRFNLQFGAGPAFYLASLDREALGGSEVQYGESFYGAHGRAFGFKGNIGAELFLSDNFSLDLAGGFRLAQINRFKYFVETSSNTKTGEMAYWVNSYDHFKVDLTGAYIELALRVYFDPFRDWNLDD